MTDSHAKKNMRYQIKNSKQKSCVLTFIGCSFFCVIPAVYAAGMNICNKKAENIQIKCIIFKKGGLTKNFHATKRVGIPHSDKSLMLTVDIITPVEN